MLQLVLLLVESYLRIVAYNGFGVDQLPGHLQVLSTDLCLLLKPFLRLEAGHGRTQVGQQRVHIVLIRLRVIHLGEAVPRVGHESRYEVPPLADGVNALSKRGVLVNII